MPECTEIFIMSKFINDELGHRDVLKLEKNPISKNKCDLSVLENKIWKIKSISKGKEMILEFYNDDEQHFLKIGFARIGSIGVFTYNDINSHEFVNKAMLRIYTRDKIYAILDFTRYVFWRWSSEWDSRRSPDIVLEHNAWRAFLFHHRNIKYFNRPIFEIFADQRFFNGIGTFSRTEILCRTRFSPFTPFSQILKNDVMRKDFFDTSKETLESIVRLGGLQFPHWVNPYGQSKELLNSWIKCYQKEKKDGTIFLKDKDGRRFWCQKKWKLDYIKWITAKEEQDRIKNKNDI